MEWGNFMTIKEFADQLNGRKYGNEITGDEMGIACDAGFVVIFGASDDLCELRGAIDDEVGSYGDMEIVLTADGTLFPESEDCKDCKYWNSAKKSAKTINALWGKDGYSWIYETDIPHETFDILENGKKYCRGIVFELSSLL